MAEPKIYKPRCCGCPNRILYMEATSATIKGVSLKFGEKYCTGGKRTRQFKRSDPKTFTPQWCPLRKTPAELRIYHFKDDKAETLAAIMRLHGIECRNESWYAVRLEANTNLTAIELHNRLKVNTPSNALGQPWQRCEVVEIDDGLAPYCFYQDSYGKTQVVMFNTARARKNKMEQDLK